MPKRLYWTIFNMLQSSYGLLPCFKELKNHLHTIQCSLVLSIVLIPTKEGLLPQNTCCANVRQLRTTINNRLFCWHTSPQRWLLVAQPRVTSLPQLTTVILYNVQNYRYLRIVAIMEWCSRHHALSSYYFTRRCFMTKLWN